MDLVPYKTCSFDCIYCQLGRTTRKTIERREHVPVHEILSQLEDALSLARKTDCVTLSGSGEPTLNSGIRDLLREIKRMTSIPVAVLTNGSLLYDEEVRRDLLSADIVLPSLDAVRKETFELVNRPHRSLEIDQIVKGLKSFSRDFSGKLWLEVMLVKAINDTMADMAQMKRVISAVEPDRVQLNTVARPPSEKFAHPLNVEELKERRALLGGNCEIVAEFRKRKQVAYSEDTKSAIIELIRRRPVTLQDISSSLGIHANEVIKYLEVLEKNGMIGVRAFGGLKYYECE